VQLFAQIPPLIAVEPTESDALAGRPTQIELTPAGERAIRECGQWVSEYGDTKVLAAYC
jgi:hypothetical protein